MRAVFKYALPSGPGTSMLALYAGAKPLTVQMQHGYPTLWMLVNPENARMTYEVACFGTGEHVPPGSGEYIGTVQDGALVWHYFAQFID